jgi:DNA-binding MarR family transcriptional regulator
MNQPPSSTDDPVDPATLDLGSLAYFVGLGFNQAVAAALEAEGYAGIKPSFGFVVQHLIGGPKTATQLAGLLGITQQAVSKRLRDMSQAGLLDEFESGDARQRLVGLSAKGQRLVKRTRTLRVEVCARMLEPVTAADIATAKAALLVAITRLDLVDAVEHRQVREGQ